MFLCVPLVTIVGLAAGAACCVPLILDMDKSTYLLVSPVETSDSHGLGVWTATSVCPS